MAKLTAGWPKRTAPLAPGVRLSIRGRTVRLRGLRRVPSGPLWLLTILGPGLVAANAGNDAGGIATYAQVGAKYGGADLSAHDGPGESRVVVTIQPTTVYAVDVRVGQM